MAVATLSAELVGLAFFGAFAALVTLVFGWQEALGGGSSTWVIPAASGPVAELYRSRPPRRRVALTVALLLLLVVSLLGTAAVEQLFPPLADLHLDFLAGMLVGLPVSAAVFAWIAPGRIA